MCILLLTLLLTLQLTLLLSRVVFGAFIIAVYLYIPTEFILLLNLLLTLQLTLLLNRVAFVSVRGHICMRPTTKRKGAKKGLEKKRPIYEKKGLRAYLYAPYKKRKGAKKGLNTQLAIA
jgi:hypothetical protein